MNLFKQKKIGIIGAGNMGQAIIKGLLEAKLFTPEHIFVSNRSAGKLEKVKKLYGVNTLFANDELIEKTDIVIVAVKPQDLEEALLSGRTTFSNQHMVASLAAGVDFKSLRKHVPEGNLVRVMMNTPVFIRKGVIGICCQNSIYEQTMRELFAPLGLVVKLEEGDQFEAFTVASSSGTGFIFELMTYWQEWIEEHGIDAEDARDIVVQTFLGTALMAENSTENLEEMQSRVVSKKGMTAAGLESMRSMEVEGLMRMSFNKAAIRYRELGNNR
jgi:pyrroline-5-carboxylate reductase